MLEISAYSATLKASTVSGAMGLPSDCETPLYITIITLRNSAHP
jgi:hypothetical protein